MPGLTESERKEILNSFNNDCIKNKALQKALQSYLSKHGLALTGREIYKPGIDFASVSVDGFQVLTINLPPVSNYDVEETEYTNTYLKKTA